jgi:adenylosuccinate lyase
MKALKESQSLEKLVHRDPSVRNVLSEREIKSCFDPRNYLKHLDEIYKRVFG